LHTWFGSSRRQEGTSILPQVTRITYVDRL
jgi:hypothetical protein